MSVYWWEKLKFKQFFFLIICLFRELFENFYMQYVNFFFFLVSRDLTFNHIYLQSCMVSNLGWFINFLGVFTLHFCNTKGVLMHPKVKIKKKEGARRAVKLDKKKKTCINSSNRILYCQQWKEWIIIQQSIRHYFFSV